MIKCYNKLITVCYLLQFQVCEVLWRKTKRMGGVRAQLCLRHMVYRL